MATPYVTPEVLRSAPTGISWSSLPWRNATDAEQAAEILNICTRATDDINGWCHQPLRATVDTEVLVGPRSSRMCVNPNGTVRLGVSRFPVTAVISARMSDPSGFPPVWTSIAADQLRPERPAIGTYGTSAASSAGEGGQSILLAPGYVTSADARGSRQLEVVYANGWPHGSLTSDAHTGAMSIAVDDITGWTGAAGRVHDVGLQEDVAVTSVTPSVSGAVSGPGALHLSSALGHDHDAGVMVTAMPGTVVQAAILLCVAQALTRGATATTVQSQPGASQGAGGGIKELEQRAFRLLQPFRRVV